MIEIPPTAYPTVLPLLANAKQPVVPFSVCEGYNPGRIFLSEADNPHTPAGAAIWLACGYLYLVGEPGAAPAPAGLSRLLHEQLVPAWWTSIFPPT